MLDRKRRLFRLIENYMNDFQGNAVQEMYGNGAKIKVHSMNESYSEKSILFEIVIVFVFSIKDSTFSFTGIGFDLINKKAKNEIAIKRISIT